MIWYASDGALYATYLVEALLHFTPLRPPRVYTLPSLRHHASGVGVSPSIVTVHD